MKARFLWRGLETTQTPDSPTFVASREPPTDNCYEGSTPAPMGLIFPYRISKMLDITLNTKRNDNIESSRSL
jgi:hypothetical protein